MAKEIIWYNLTWQNAVKKLSSNAEQGLSVKRVKENQKKFGKNQLAEEKSLSRLRIFAGQLKSPLIYILIIAGIITLFLKEYTDSIVIFGAVALNTIVGFFQENKASQALQKLKKVVTYNAKVLRDGNLKVVMSQDLVPGDIIILTAGDRVPADGRIIEANDLKINEMALTGEWLAAEKSSDILPEKTSLADRDNMVYMGTVVEHGRAKIIVTSTGSRSEIGKVAEMVKQGKEEKTPLQKKIAHFSKIIGLIVGLISILIFIDGMIVRTNLRFAERFYEMFTMAVAVAVAAIPEGLPVAVTVILALGMQRILKKKGLVRKLLAAETLGSTSIIATDKTATLTQGKMQVSRIVAGKELIGNHKGDHLLCLKIVTLCNEAFIENPDDVMGKWLVRGRPTDKALLIAGIEAGLNKRKIEQALPKIAELTFDSVNKYQATAHKVSKKEQVLYVSGAPEKVLEVSSSVKINGQEEKLTPSLRLKVEKKLESLTKKGLRVVGAAYKKTNQSRVENYKIKIENLTFIGFIGLKDPLRKDVKQAIQICREAGMKPILVTGDHKLTALAVAREIGLKTKAENVINGNVLEQMSDKEFAKKVKNIEVYTRAEPAHKMRIIKAWQSRGEVVAMTGDGINDAPALKAADIGVALGSGTDVAKEVSDLILLPNSFSIIVAAIEEGRAIIDNIRKVITYLLASSFAEIILISTSLFFGWPLPVLTAQILWVNLIEDGPLSLSLAFEKKEKDLMKRKPEEKKFSLLTKEMKVIIFIIGTILNLLLLTLFIYLLKFTNYEIARIRTIIFVGLSIDSIFFVFSCKSLRRNIWQINIFSNRFLIISWLVSVLMLVLAVYFPPLQALLKTVPLNFFDWQLVLGLGVFSIMLIEATKWIFISRKHK